MNKQNCKLNDPVKLIGMYNEMGYNIFNAVTNELLYEAGNSPYESTGQLDINDPDRESLPTILTYCDRTGKEMAKEVKGEWLGCEYDEIEE